MRAALVTKLLFLFFGVVWAAQLTASPLTVDTVQNVTVQWTGVQNVQDNDWVGVYSPSTDPDASYLGYQWAKSCPNYQSGTCSVVFELMNMRSEYQFRYFQYIGNVSTARLVATSNLVQVVPNVPMQGHLQLTGDPRQMRVMWVQGTEKEQSIVEYRRADSQKVQIARGVSETYGLEDLVACLNGSNAVLNFKSPGQIHDVLLEDLRPRTEYFYRFGTRHRMSEHFSFVTPSEPGAHVGVNIVTFGDMGTYRCEDENGWCEDGSKGTSDKILAEMKKGNRFDMVLQIGDISYAVGWAERWDQFFWQIQPVAARIPWMATIGNHEYDHSNQPFKPNWSNYGDDSGGECGIPFFYRFHPPNNDLWWSVDFGNVHFTLISLEHDFTKGSEQFMWLQKDLASVDRTVTPFLVVGGHRPMYCSGNYSDDYRMSLHIQMELEDLFYINGVDLALWGHYHSYERTCPVYKGQCNPKGTTHVVIGMAGQSLDDSWMEKPEWSEYRDATHFGFSILRTNSTTLELKYVGDNVDDPIDIVWIDVK